MAFAGFVVDYGLMFVGRRQAQNAADGAALAGAIAMALDADTRAGDGPAKTAAYRVSQSHAVVGEAPNVIDPSTGDATDIMFYTEAPAKFPPECADDSCIRVDVYRNQERGNPLPTFFMSIVGVTGQGTKATATAQAAAANGSQCLKPWLIPDKFTDVNGNGVFDSGVDTYTAPGYTTADIGTTVLLNPAGPADALAPSLFFQIDVNNYYDDIVGCRLQRAIGQTVDTAPGASNGLTRNGVDELIARNGGKPVTVPIGMFSPAEWAAQDRQSGHYDLTIVNMMGFRIDGMRGRALYGTIVGTVGDILAGGTTPDAPAQFLRVVRLIR